MFSLQFTARMKMLTFICLSAYLVNHFEIYLYWKTPGTSHLLVTIYSLIAIQPIQPVQPIQPIPNSVALMVAIKLKLIFIIPAIHLSEASKIGVHGKY